MPLLTNETWRGVLARQIDIANDRHDFRLAAFVFMPEHLHLLVYPVGKSEVSDLLQAIKKPFSFRIKQVLKEQNSPLLGRLTISERPGKLAFRFRQEGPGYDRNLRTETAVRAAIDYLHANPVRRGLVEQARQWKWSSARWYESDGREVDSDLPKIHGLPAEFFTSAN
jgi:putative transposase